MKKEYFCLFLIGSSLMACNVSETIDMQGKLVFSGGGGKIMVLDLIDRESDPEVIYESPASISIISRITKVTSDSFLFDECQAIGGCTVKEFNVKTKKMGVLCSGRLPTYVPNHHIFFFYHKSELGEWWLSLFHLGNRGIRKKIAVAPDKRKLKNQVERSITVPAVSISPNEIIFNGNDNKLWIYQINESQKIPTGLTNSIPILWRSKTKQLFCQEIDTGELFLADINSDSKETLSVLSKSYGHLYVPEYDSLIYGKARFRFPYGEAYDIFIYSFEERKELRIKSDIHIRSGIWMK